MIHSSTLFNHYHAIHILENEVVSSSVGGVYELRLHGWHDGSDHGNEGHDEHIQSLRYLSWPRYAISYNYTLICYNIFCLPITFNNPLKVCFQKRNLYRFIVQKDIKG